MKLKTASDGFFEMVVLGYEHPDITEDRWDSNWLIVSGKVVTGDRTWRFVHPCVTTFELQELAGWLESGPAPAAEFAFTEPHLTFVRLRRPQPTLGVRFAHECAPPWLQDEEERKAGILCEFPLSGENAAEFLGELQNTLIEYPVRGGAA